METIGKAKLWSFLDGADKAQASKVSEVRSGSGHRVGNYLELARKVAELQFRNRDHVLLFRGQNADYRNAQKNTSLKPSLLRPGKGLRANPSPKQVIGRFEKLATAERALAAQYTSEKYLGYKRLGRQRILRWSLLQHYEVCSTPLLDVTHSLRVAASFASLGAQDRAFVFVLGVPNISGAITASAESGLQIVRLSSVCPPSAVRPHIQEGYLLGEYPEIAGYEQKELYQHFETDFGRRLVAKFWFDPRTFWKADRSFPRIKRKALYPNDSDPIFQLAMAIRTNLGRRAAHSPPSISAHARRLKPR